MIINTVLSDYAVLLNGNLHIDSHLSQTLFCIEHCIFSCFRVIGAADGKLKLLSISILSHSVSVCICPAGRLQKLFGFFRIISVIV